MPLLGPAVTLTNPMSTHRRPGASRIRFLGVVAAALLVLLGLTYLFSASARSDAEDDAEARATDYATRALAPALDENVVTGDLVGSDERTLLVQAQSQILDRDGRVAAVRIWTRDGDLIFSTSQRDAVASVVEGENPLIAAAAAGDAGSETAP